MGKRRNKNSLGWKDASEPSTPRSQSPQEFDTPKEVGDWFESSQMKIMDSIRARSSSAASSKSMAEAQKKLKDLATRGGDVEGISFTGDSLHYVYYQTKFERRGVLLYLIFEQLARSSGPQQELQKIITSELVASMPTMRVASYGGGPGTDIAGFFWAARHFLRHTKGSPPIPCCLLDFEKSWRQHLPVLQNLMGRRLDLSFETCDVTKPLADKSNAKARDWVSADLHIFSYVANETSTAARANRFAFYADLVRQARVGAVFLFTDVQRHSAPVFDEIYGQARDHVRRLDVPPTALIKAQVMLLFKTAPPVQNAPTID